MPSSAAVSVTTQPSRASGASASGLAQAPTCLFGTHLTYDGYRGDHKRLASMDLVFTVLSELPELLGMHPIITPYVVRANANDKKDEGGYSGFVMIAESHISVHTFPARQFVSCDVYTCQGTLDKAKISEYFERMFGVAESEVHMIKRGTKFPAAPLVDYRVTATQ